MNNNKASNYVAATRLPLYSLLTTLLLSLQTKLLA